eukprot:1668103-Amphidinium_carterae.1
MLRKVIYEIDFDTSVVPKGHMVLQAAKNFSPKPVALGSMLLQGAFSLNEEHKVVPSREFKGLNFKQAIVADKYAHFRS